MRAEQPDLIEAFRARALGAAAVVGALAIGGIFVLKEDAPELYDGLTSDLGLGAVIVSVITGLITLRLLWKRRFGPARLTSSVTVGAVIGGLALAQEPDFLPGVLTLDEAAASDATLIPLLGCTVLAAVILFQPCPCSTGSPSKAPSTPSSTRSSPPTPRRNDEGSSGTDGPARAGDPAIFGAILFFTHSEALRLISALALLVGIALAVAAIATPEFMERDVEDD